MKQFSHRLMKLPGCSLSTDHTISFLIEKNFFCECSEQIREIGFDSTPVRWSFWPTLH